MGQWVLVVGFSTIPIAEVTRDEEERKQGSLGLVRHLGLGLPTCSTPAVWRWSTVYTDTPRGTEDDPL